MKYICNVKYDKLIKHVIETSTGNLEVTEGKYPHGEKRIEYKFKGIRIDKVDFNINACDKGLSEIVLACELVKFIKEQ